MDHTGCHMDHTGCHQLVLLTNALLGLSLPGVTRLVTCTMLAVINWRTPPCFSRRPCWIRRWVRSCGSCWARRGTSPRPRRSGTKLSSESKGLETRISHFRSKGWNGNRNQALSKLWASTGFGLYSPLPHHAPAAARGLRVEWAGQHHGGDGQRRGGGPPPRLLLPRLRRFRS
jgi:hypothetical protein